MNLGAKKKRDLIISLVLLAVSVVIIAVMAIVLDDSPVIKVVTPSSGLSGDVVSIKGRNFGESQHEGNLYLSGVKFESELIKSWTSTEIIVMLPDDFASGMLYLSCNNQNSNSVLFSNKITLPAVVEGADYLKPYISAVSSKQFGAYNRLEIKGFYFGSNRVKSKICFILNDGRVVYLHNADYLSWSNTDVVVKIPDLQDSGSLYLENPAGRSDAVSFSFSPGLGSTYESGEYEFSVNYLVAAETGKGGVDFMLAFPSLPDFTFSKMLERKVPGVLTVVEKNYIDFYRFIEKKSFLQKNYTAKYSMKFYNKQISADYNEKADYELENINGLNISASLRGVLTSDETLYTQAVAISNTFAVSAFSETASASKKAALCFRLAGYDAEAFSGIRISEGSLEESCWVVLKLKDVGDVVFDPLVKADSFIDGGNELALFKMHDTGKFYAVVALIDSCRKSFYKDPVKFSTGGVFGFCENNGFSVNNNITGMQHYFINLTKPET